MAPPLKADLKVEQAQFKRDLITARNLTGESSRDIIHRQGRLFARDAVNRTLPKKKVRAERVIKADVRRVYKQWLDPAKIRNVRLRRMVRQDDVNTFNAVLRAAARGGHKWATGYEAVKATDLGYQGAKRTGYRPANLKQYALNQRPVKAIVKDRQNRVGRAKAGWLPSLTGLGGSDRRKWVTRHSAIARGHLENRLGKRFAPSVTLINHAAGIGNSHPFLANVLRSRRLAMIREAKLISKGVKKLPTMK